MNDRCRLGCFRLAGSLRHGRSSLVRAWPASRDFLEDGENLLDVLVGESVAAAGADEGEAALAALLAHPPLRAAEHGGEIFRQMQRLKWHQDPPPRAQ